MRADQRRIAELEHRLGIKGHETNCWRCNTPPEDLFMAELIDASNWRLEEIKRIAPIRLEYPQ